MLKKEERRVVNSKYVPIVYSMMKRIALFCMGVMLASAAHAQKYDRSFRDWSVYTNNGSCYMASAPVRQAGNYSRRGQPYMLVVHRNAKQDEVNVSSGYPYKPKKDVVARVDNKEYKLFTKGENAWAYDAAADRALIAAMKGGTSLSVKGTSEKGTWSEDKYSLMGFTAAYDRMKSLCK